MIPATIAISCQLFRMARMAFKTGWMLIVMNGFIRFRDRVCLSFTWQTYNQNSFPQHLFKKNFTTCYINNQLFIDGCGDVVVRCGGCM